MIVTKQFGVSKMVGDVRKTTDYYGRIFLSNSCGFYQITIANDLNNMEAVFLQTNTVTRVSYRQVDQGAVVDNFYPTVLNVGYIGELGTTVTNDGVRTTEYNVWKCMLGRVYGGLGLEAYKFCIVSDEFLNYSYFHKWYNLQVGCHQGFQLDKDILCEKEKVYAPDTCVLVPSEINMFFAKTGGKRGEYPIGVIWDKGMRKFKSSYNNGKGGKVVTYHNNEWEAFLSYKRAKESRGKALAEKWRGKIDNRVYEKLINYKVLITD